MSHIIEKRLSEIGLELHNPPSPVANYIPYRLANGLVYISGQLPLDGNGKLIVGKLGAELSSDEGWYAAKLCAINLLCQLKAAVEGNWERFGCTVQIVGFVNSTPYFQDHPAVINGASELLVKVLNDDGRHARTAIGVSSLPLGAAVEVNGIFSLR